MSKRSRSHRYNEQPPRSPRSRKGKGTLEQRIDDMPETRASTLSNALFAIDLFFIILIVLFFTKRLGDYKATLFLVPILSYVVLESPRFRLRALERPTWTLLTDVACAVGIVLLCIEIDRVLMGAGAGEILLSVLYLAVAVVLSEFLCRNKWAYYLMFPVSFVLCIALALRYIPQYEVLAFTLGAILAVSMVLSYRNHGYYFGFGRDERILTMVSERKWGNEEFMKQTFSEEEMRQMVFVREKRPKKERSGKRGRSGGDGS